MTPRRSWFRLKEGGLVLVIALMGCLLTLFGGSVRQPKFAVDSSGQRHRVFVTEADGKKTPVFEVRNKFLNPANLALLAKDTSFIAIMAVGMTFVIIAGQIDLSIASIYALASVLGALVLHSVGSEGSHWHSKTFGIGLGIATCLGTGLLCGLINGAMIVAMRVHPFIITLGTMAIFRGVSFVITKGLSVGGLPPEFRALVRPDQEAAVENLNWRPLFVMVSVAIIGGLILSRQRVGRCIYAIGGNELAARYSGIRVGAVKMLVFAASGLAAGISALLALGYYGSATSADGNGYELDVIAAAVVGGASLAGGKGSALGALLGALTIQIIASGIVILGVDQNYSRIIIGSVVVVAVVLDQLNQWWSSRRLTKRMTSN